MQGVVKTFLPEKQYGFIKGDDRKDYFFHINDLQLRSDADRIGEGVVLTFDQKATPKGYSAIKIALPDQKVAVKFAVPDETYFSKRGSYKGWETVDSADWTVHGSSRHSPDEARSQMLNHARLIGANAVIYAEYYKTTGSEPGTGRGTHYYTIHNFRARPVNIGKRSVSGVSTEALTGINARATEMKSFLLNKTKNSSEKTMAIWLVALLVSVLSALGAAQGSVGIGGYVMAGVVLLLTFMFNHSTDYDWWLEKHS
jgi:cold shock CspA family protein